MNADLVIKRLDELAELRTQQSKVRAQFQAKREKILKPIRAKLTEIDEAERTALLAVNDEAAKAESDIKAATLAHGQTVKSERLQAVWYRGSVRWDASYLEGMAASMPAILKARSESEPTVQIREIRPATPAS